MIISSTEFQQRVGYYLALAAKGEVVYIEKRKPGKTVFLLKMDPMKQTMTAKQRKRKKILDDMKKLNIRFPYNDGVKYQRSVRQ